MLNGKEEIERIIEGCIKQDRKAQEKLYRSFYRSMMNLCIRYTRNETDAMEALNSGFLKVFNGIRSYDAGKSSLYTWISVIIVRSCLDVLKHKLKNGHELELKNGMLYSVRPEALSKIESEELLAIIRQLPPVTQAVFNMFVIEGFSHKEIAKQLSFSESTSKWYLSEARARLQKILKSEKYI